MNLTDTPPQSMKHAFDALRAASRADPFPDWPTRARRLQKLERLVLDHVDAIATAISDDFGHRSRGETELLEVFPSVEGLRHARRQGKRWMKERRASVSIWFQPGSARVLPQPLGVVGVIVPWNYPLFLLMGPLASAIAAGNRAMVKLSEYTPRFAELMGKLLPEALGPDVVAVVNGDAEIAAAFSSLPFDHLLFTGSTPVGRSVMAVAAANLVPVTLELGGKSPALITPATVANDARFANAVRRIVVGKALNGGQTCIAPDYVLLPRAAMPRFEQVARELLRTQYPEGAASDDYTGVASERQHARLQAWLAEAKQGGATATELMPAGPSATRKMPLTLITDGPAGSRVMTDEIFGPLLPLVACESVEQAVAYVNERPRPLALYLFSDSASEQERVLRDTVAGGVSVNETLLHIAQEELPFGGVGASGMGHYHGRFGFDTMSKLKPIFRQSRLNGVGLLSPPYKGLFARMLKLMLKR